MTIDEKIEKAAEKFHPCEGECDSYGICLECSYANTFRRGANFVKSEMLADMQKLVEALEFYADMAKDDNKNLDDCLERACIDRAESKEYNLSGKYVAEKAVKALAEFNAKYLKKEK